MIEQKYNSTRHNRSAYSFRPKTNVTSGARHREISRNSLDINLINRTMPRALTAVTGQTFGQLLTRTLPSTFKLLESMGYKMHVSAKDPGNYVINRRPPDHFLQPYEKVMKFDNFISFSNGNGLLLLSQDRAGSARGASVDYEILDEALTINKQRYDEETSPTNRGNEGIFRAT